MQRLPEAAAGAGEAGGRLFRKYVAMFIGLVSLVLLLSGGLGFWLSYQQNREALAVIQQEKAAAVAQWIENFFELIGAQVSWTTHAGWAQEPIELRRRDYARLLRAAPAITELVQIDASGREQLRVSRSAGDSVGSGRDHSGEPSFTATTTGRIWVGPVFVCADAQPCLTMAMAARGDPRGVTVATVTLKSVRELISGLKIGQNGYAYLIDRDGNVIAQPGIGPVAGDALPGRQLREAPLTANTANRSTSDGPPAPLSAILRNGINGQLVLSVNRAVDPIGWRIFVEVPLKEALGPLYSSGISTGALLAFGIAFSALAALILARRMVVPIRLMQAGAARFGAGDFDQRIEVNTGDELEGLADEFNRMANALQQSYANLEAKVEERTAELTDALDVIASSISYASRIQRALLPEPETFDAIFGDYFILWEPRDVVSGDMYWLTRWGDGVLVCVGDCTGHGVPGAFVTLIASAALEQAQLDVDPGAVGALISRMNQLVKKTLKQTERRGEADDGMDLGVCYVTADHTRVTFAGAGISLLTAPPGANLVEIKGSRRGIGYRRVPLDRSFSEVELPVTPGTRFYMTSDGLIDQIGGERRRAFGLARTLTVLDSHRHEPMAMQKSLLRTAMADYQGQEIRRDDWLMLGFRLDGAPAASRNMPD